MKTCEMAISFACSILKTSSFFKECVCHCSWHYRYSYCEKKNKPLEAKSKEEYVCCS